MARPRNACHDHLESGFRRWGLFKVRPLPELLRSLRKALPAQAAPMLENSGNLSAPPTFHHPLCPSAPKCPSGRQEYVWVRVLSISHIEKLRPTHWETETY